MASQNKSNAAILRHAVSSTNVKSAGYDPVTKTLQVEFHNGSIYNYANVSTSQALQFSQAKSKGSFVGQIQKSHIAHRVQ
jgi:KTSC domain-containing protein